MYRLIVEEDSPKCSAVLLMLALLVRFHWMTCRESCAKGCPSVIPSLIYRAKSLVILLGSLRGCAEGALWSLEPASYGVYQFFKWIDNCSVRCDNVMKQGSPVPPNLYKVK